MRFTPKTENEIQFENLLEPGIYNFSVVKAEDAISKAGNEMIKLNLKVWDKNGHERFVFDYLLEALAYKIKHFCDAVGLADKYQNGAFNASDCLDKSGNVKVDIQKDKTGLYHDKNIVVDYLVETTASQSKKDTFEDSDIPF